MNRTNFLTMREQLMENIGTIVDDFYTGPVDENGRPIGIKVVNRDELVTKLCDMVCETMDPAGLE
tara:strand:+ start:130 stop:324 length:195 start_codon:yes stop_codon:yes gene_type:complete